MKKVKPERIPSAGSQYKVESSVDYIRRGHHDTGTHRNEDLPHPSEAYQSSQKDEDYVQPPEYSEDVDSGYGGRTKIKVGPVSKPNASKPNGARRDSNPGFGHSRGTSGPTHPKSKPETARPGGAPRHPSGKIVTSTPDGGPRPAKGKDSSNVNDSTAYGRNYGDRSPVGGPTVRKRSDLVPANSSMISSDNNPKHREAAYPGIGRESLKDAKPKK